MVREYLSIVVMYRKHHSLVIGIIFCFFTLDNRGGFTSLKLFKRFYIGLILCH